MNNLKSVQNGLWFIMKVTLLNILITSVSIMMANAVETRGQGILDRRVSLNVVNTEIQDVLSLLSKEADVKFTYSPKLIEAGRKVSLHVEDEKLSDVLPRILQSDISYKVIGQQIALKLESAEAIASVATGSANAAFEVTGKVTDFTGAGLPGVSVMVKGTTIGTATDADGVYKLSVPSGDVTLVFSFIGYATEEAPVNNQATVDMMMSEDIMSLNEVVVVGYGTQEKKEVTGAISTVNNSEIMKSAAVSISNSLAGRVAGLIVNQTNSEPGRDDARILVRGVGTTGNTQPLIVIDGIANRDGISRIDPNDIESMTVLKDASAAIYGAQAANGVILITTKKGKSGTPKIVYTFNQGFVSPTRKLKLANTALYTRSVNRLGGTQISEDPSQPNTDWFEGVFKSHSLQSRHNVAVSGGNENTTYYVSFGTTHQNGLIQNDNTTNYRQYNFRSNIETHVSERIKIGLQLAGRHEDRKWLQFDDNTIYQAAIRAAPTIPTYVAPGLPSIGFNNYNPLAIVTGPGYRNNKNDVFNGTLTAEYKLPFVEGLSVDGFAAVDLFNTFGRLWFQPYSVYSRNAQGDIVEDNDFIGESQRRLRQDYQRAQSITLHGKIKYERTFGMHDISGFLAYEQNEVNADTSWVQRTGYESARIDQLFAGSADADNSSNTGFSAQTARQNYFGRVGYSYNDRYLAQFHFRYDGSYRFPDNGRWGFFPGVSLGWRMSEENFLKNNPLVSNLKLRGSWGKLGNDRTNPFQYLNQYNFASPGTGYVIGGKNVNALIPGVVANPNITWETKTTTDIGLDVGLLNNRLTAEFDVFFERRNNILSRRNVTVPDYTGLQLPLENIAKINNNGIEAAVTYRGTVGDVSYNVGGNFTYARSKVIFNDEGNVYPESYQKGEGHIVGSYLALDYKGVYRSEADLEGGKYLTYNNKGVATTREGLALYRDVNGDNIVDNKDRIRIDRSNVPQIQYGITLGAQWKGFDFSALFQGQGMAVRYLRYSFSNGANGLDYFLANSWAPDNQNASLPKLNEGNSNDELSTLWLRSVNFLRLKNVELGYTLPKLMVAKVGLENVRFYVNGFNLLTFDKYKKDGMPDPETIDVEGWQFPQTKSINFGLNVTL